LNEPCLRGKCCSVIFITSTTSNLPAGACWRAVLCNGLTSCGQVTSCDKRVRSLFRTLNGFLSPDRFATITRPILDERTREEVHAVTPALPPAVSSSHYPRWVCTSVCPDTRCASASADPKPSASPGAVGKRTFTCHAHSCSADGASPRRRSTCVRARSGVPHQALLPQPLAPGRDVARPGAPAGRGCRRSWAPAP